MKVTPSLNLSVVVLTLPPSVAPVAFPDRPPVPPEYMLELNTPTSTPTDPLTAAAVVDQTAPLPPPNPPALPPVAVAIIVVPCLNVVDPPSFPAVLLLVSPPSALLPTTIVYVVFAINS